MASLRLSLWLHTHLLTSLSFFLMMLLTVGSKRGRRQGDRLDNFVRLMLLCDAVDPPSL